MDQTCEQQWALRGALTPEDICVIQGKRRRGVSVAQSAEGPVIHQQNISGCWLNDLKNDQ